MRVSPKLISTVSLFTLLSLVTPTLMAVGSESDDDTSATDTPATIVPLKLDTLAAQAEALHARDVGIYGADFYLEATSEKFSQALRAAFAGRVDAEGNPLLRSDEDADSLVSQRFWCRVKSETDFFLADKSVTFRWIASTIIRYALPIVKCFETYIGIEDVLVLLGKYDRRTLEIRAPWINERLIPLLGGLPDQEKLNILEEALNPLDLGELPQEDAYRTYLASIVPGFEEDVVATLLERFDKIHGMIDLQDLDPTLVENRPKIIITLLKNLATTRQARLAEVIAGGGGPAGD